MPRYGSDKQAVPPKIVADAALQTDSMDKEDESCQTGSPERRDFQVQATIQQGQPISTQIDNSIKCDFQAQAAIPRENESIAVQTIKEVIAMPNLPSSVAQTPAKKRRMSSVSTSGSTSTNTAVIDLTLPQNPIPGESGDALNNQQASVGSNSDRLSNKQADIDDAILNSQVYKIYCRNEDPKEAMKQINELKTCFDFQQPTQPFPTEEDFKRACEKTLKNLWKTEPRLKDTKFEKIKKYIDRYTFGYAVHRLDREMYEIFTNCFTIIKMLIPNGYEYWYVANFEKGLSQSKWYRAESVNNWRARHLAQLNVMGIKKAIIDKFQYLYHLKKKSEKTTWFDFAYYSVRVFLYNMFPTDDDSYLRVDFEIREAKTDTTMDVYASLLIQKIDSDSDWTTFKTYHGKSTRPLKKTRQSNNEKEMMENEAKKAALVECYKELFGFNKFDDWCVDELGRTIEFENHFQF